jgi:hypothetical protein
MRHAYLASFLIVAIPVLAQDNPVIGRNKPVRVAGVDLLFGMTTESVLAKYAIVQGVQVRKMGEGFYFVAENLNETDPITHSLFFKKDRLSGLACQLLSSSQDDVASLIHLLHQALRNNETKTVQMKADTARMDSGQTATMVKLLIEGIEVQLSAFKHEGKDYSMANVKIGERPGMANQQLLPKK